MRTLIITATLLFGSLAWAETETADPKPLPEVTPGEVPEAEVTIIPRKDARVEEYRRGGQLFMLKIIPKKGRPYYLIDTDGDGELDSRRNDLDNPSVNQWILFRW